MTLSGKQIKQLRSMCHTLKPCLIIGKGGVTPAVSKQADEALEAHELIKCNVLDGCGLPAAAVARELAESVEAEVVQVIGHRFSIYRETSREDIEKIQLA